MSALDKLRAGYAMTPQLCMDFLTELGYYVGALGNEEIVQLTEEILDEMDAEEA